MAEEEKIEINENSTELEIVRHALGLALAFIEGSEDQGLDVDDEDAAVLDFCGRILEASEAGDMASIRNEIAEMAAEDGDGDDA